MSSSPCSASHSSQTVGKVKHFQLLVFINGIMFSGRKQVLFLVEKPAVSVPVSLDHVGSDAGRAGTPGLPSCDFLGCPWAKCERWHLMAGAALGVLLKHITALQTAPRPLLGALCLSVTPSCPALTRRRFHDVGGGALGGSCRGLCPPHTPLTASAPLSQLPPELLPRVQHP